MKPTDLKCYQKVADVIGEAYADYELQRAIDYKDREFSEDYFLGFKWKPTHQGFCFWDLVNIGKNPYEHGHEKPELSEITPSNSDKIGARLVPEEEKSIYQMAREAMDKQRSDGPTNKYKVLCKGVEIDVYDVLMAYSVTNPADQHAIKKMIMPGKRGVKDANQDRREAIQSLERAIELAQSDK